jgi:hypothetical protein
MNIITTAGAAPITKRSALVENLAPIAMLVATRLASAPDQIPPTIQTREPCSHDIDLLRVGSYSIETRGRGSSHARPSTPR